MAEQVTKSYVAGENIVERRGAGDRRCSCRRSTSSSCCVPAESRQRRSAPWPWWPPSWCCWPCFYLWRVRRDYWQQPKMVGLFGLLLVLAAAAARVPGLLVARDRLELGFLIPAALLRLPRRQPVRLPGRRAHGATGGGVHRPDHGDLALVVLRGGGDADADPAGVGGVVARPAEPGGVLSRRPPRPAGRGPRLVLLWPRCASCWRRCWACLGGIITGVVGPGDAAGPRLVVRHHHHPDAARPHRPQPSGAAPDRGGGARDLQPRRHGGQSGRNGPRGPSAPTRCSPGPWRTTTTSARRCSRSTSSRTSSGSPTRTIGCLPSSRRRSSAATSPRACASPGSYRHPARRGPGHRHPPRHQPHALLLPQGARRLTARSGGPGRLPPPGPQAAGPRRW